MENFISNHLGEFLLSGVLGAFAWAFRAWSKGLSTATEKIINEMKTLSSEFHQFVVDVERRVTRVETRVDMAYRDIKNKEKSNET